MSDQNTEKALAKRQDDYVAVFSSEAGKRILDDLATFGRLGQPCVIVNEKTGEVADERFSFLLQGRNEVVVRILQHLNLSREELFLLYSGKGRLV